MSEDEYFHILQVLRMARSALAEEKLARDAEKRLVAERDFVIRQLEIENRCLTARHDNMRKARDSLRNDLDEYMAMFKQLTDTNIPVIVSAVNQAFQDRWDGKLKLRVREGQNRSPPRVVRPIWGPGATVHYPFSSNQHKSPEKKTAETENVHLSNFSEKVPFCGPSKKVRTSPTPVFAAANVCDPLTKTDLTKQNKVPEAKVETASSKRKKSHLSSELLVAPPAGRRSKRIKTSRAAGIVS